MSLDALMTQTVEVFRTEVVDEDGTGDPIEDLVSQGTLKAYVEQTRSQELLAGRDTVLADWLFVFPAESDVQSSDVLDWNGGRFEVTGRPAAPQSPRGVHHLEVLARSVEG